MGYEANKRLKGTANAWRFQSQWAAVVSAVVIEFSGNALSAP
jgi:hypothetical protein